MKGFKAFRIVQTDGNVRGSVTELAVDSLPPGELLIRVAYSSVNYKDALAGTGMGKVVRRYPVTGGVDLAGTVEESADPRFKPGDKVLATGYELGVGHDGGYAELARLPAAWVLPLPAGLSLFEAMALGTAGFTVALCIKRLEDNGQRPGQGSILITGATGGVGCLAVDVLSKLGYGVTALTGKIAEANWLKSLGAAEVLDRRNLQFGNHALETARWAGAIDSVGGETLAWLTRTVQPWGNIVSVGLAAGSQLDTTVMPFILRGVALLGVTASGCPADWRAGLWQRLADELKPRHLDAVVRQTVELEGLPGVFQTILSGKMVGRAVVKIGAD
jgi:NADPH2:quinone reductase